MRVAFIGTRGVPASYSGFETCVEQVGRRMVEIEEPQQKGNGRSARGNDAAERRALADRRSWTDVNNGLWQVGDGSGHGVTL